MFSVQVDGVLVVSGLEDAPTGRIIDASYARFYAEMLRRDPAHYLGALSIGDLREIYSHDCLSLEELERFVGDAVSRQV